MSHIENQPDPVEAIRQLEAPRRTLMALHAPRRSFARMVAGVSRELARRPAAAPSAPRPRRTRTA